MVLSLGTAYVNGVECRYLSFQKVKVDRQFWGAGLLVRLPA